MTDLPHRSAIGRLLIDPAQGAARDDARGRDGDGDLFDELTDRRGAMPLPSVAEPPARATLVVGFDGSARERDVPRQEPALWAPLHDEHFRLARAAVTYADRGRCLADRSIVHGVHPPRTRGRGHTAAVSDGAGEPGALQEILRAIEANGPITFAEYMELALYGPGGFYEAPPVGPRGDFVTSPHVHPQFGERLAGAIGELWDRLERPTPLRLTEVGAGDGTLARSVLAGIRDVPVSYTAVERSAGARMALATVPRLAQRADLAGPIDVLLANELLDNLPFRIMRDEREVLIGSEDDRLVEVLVPADPALLTEATPAGAERVIPVGASDFVDSIARMLERGFALLIDYGGLGETGGPVHGYRGHTVVDDLLTRPGETDITVGIDFDSLASHARSRGLVAFPSVSQHDALLELGLGEWLEAELRRQQRGLEAGDGRDAVRTWSGRSQATLLVDPGGLGRLRWLLLATPGLEPPDWLVRASARSRARAPLD
jgi:SAM-dependent MidA family methyltransferase